MSRPTTQERLDKIHQLALKQFDTIQSAVYDERMQCLQDRRFYSIPGAQWEDELGQQFENKPRMEVNKVHLAVIRIINEYRNNRITAKFTSKDGSANDQLADTCDGLYRADEDDSCAQEAYDNAFEEGAGGGMGAWRLRACYEDDEDEDDEQQRIRFEPIYDADSSVFFDLQAKRQDKSDARYCFVLTSMDPEAYEEEYDDVPPDSMEKSIHQTEFDWFTPDVVYVAEYYVIKEKRETIHVYQKIDDSEVRYTDEDLADEDLIAELNATGAKKIREKKIKKKRVHKYIMSGSRILEDCGEIAGPNIPVIPVYGKRWFVDNIERCMGHVRLAKDVQRLKNMQVSKLAELAALSSVEKPIFTPEQVAGHTLMWEQDNIKNYPYLLLNSITDQNGNQMPAGPIAYTKSPQIPVALAQLLNMTEQDIKDLLGSQEQIDEVNPNISGVAVDLLQNRLDMQTFIYISNFAKAVRRCGQIWLGMAKELYVEDERKMKIIGLQDEVSQAVLRRPVISSETSKTEYENDLGRAKFDVKVDIGPSSTSRRAAMVRSLVNLIGITEDPEAKQVLTAMAIMNMEGEGLGDIREFFRKKLLNMGALKPTREEEQEMAAAKANQPPDPNTIYLQAAAQEAEAKAQNARADVVLKAAKADETRAKTIETMTNVDKTEQEQALSLIDRFNQNLPTAEPNPAAGT